MGFREFVMGIPWVYRNFSAGISRPERRDWLSREVIQASEGMRVLDIGCGPADILARLGHVSYLGIDHNPSYIEQARKRYGHAARFECWDVTDPRLAELGDFDLVLLIGVLHHLTDEEITVMLSHTARALKPEGRIITFDCAIEPRQHPVAWMLANLDRGRYARSTDGYAALVAQHFTPVDVIIRHDLLKLPYTHAIITATPRGALSQAQDEPGKHG
jgi:SAM-dependent methyltransferase